MVRSGLVEGTLDVHIGNDLGFTLATVIMDHPYAPLIRDDGGRVVSSVRTHLEGARDAKAGRDQHWGLLGDSESASVLSQLHESLYSEEEMRYNTPRSGELGYPNEMVRGCLAAGIGVDGVPIADEIEMMGIKTPENVGCYSKYFGMMVSNPWSSGD